MHILLTNDDGYKSRAIEILADYLLSIGHRVTIAAPEQQQSAKAASITTLTQNLKVKLKEFTYNNGNAIAFIVKGTPVDAVQFAISYLRMIGDAPDFVISGINYGNNVGINSFYSATVAAAQQAALLNIPSMAISYDSFNTDSIGYTYLFSHLDFLFALEFNLFTKVRNSFISVNLPEYASKRLVVTHTGSQFYDIQMSEHDKFDGFNKEREFKIQGFIESNDEEMNELQVDYYELKGGAITITPAISSFGYISKQDNYLLQSVTTYLVEDYMQANSK